MITNTQRMLKETIYSKNILQNNTDQKNYDYISDHVPPKYAMPLYAKLNELEPRFSRLSHREQLRVIARELKKIEKKMNNPASSKKNKSKKKKKKNSTSAISIEEPLNTQESSKQEIEINKKDETLSNNVLEARIIESKENQIIEDADVKENKNKINDDLNESSCGEYDDYTEYDDSYDYLMTEHFEKLRHKNKQLKKSTTQSKKAKRNKKKKPQIVKRSMIILKKAEEAKAKAEEEAKAKAEAEKKAQEERERIEAEKKEKAKNTADIDVENVEVNYENSKKETTGTLTNEDHNQNKKNIYEQKYLEEKNKHHFNYGIVQKGDIFWIDFAYRDTEKTNKTFENIKPGLIFQENVDESNKTYSCTIIPITFFEDTDNYMNSKNNIEEGNLIFHPDFLTAVSKSAIQEPYGHINSNTMRAITEKTLQHIGYF